MMWKNWGKLLMKMLAAMLVEMTLRCYQCRLLSQRTARRKIKEKEEQIGYRWHLRLNIQVKKLFKEK